MTARFTLGEVEQLATEAKKRGEPISSLLRNLVVTTISEIQTRLSEERDS